MSLGTATASLVVLALLVAVVLIIFFRAIGCAVRLAGAAIAVALIGSLLGVFALGDRDGDAPQVRFSVTPARQGGWDVTIDEVPGANRYVVRMDKNQVGATKSAGTVHVDETWPRDDSYATGPVHRFEVVAEVDGGQSVREVMDICSPVVLLAARGTWENPGQPKFAHGIGSRNWRTWGYLAKQLGLSPATAGVQPTIIGAAPVQYPADFVVPKAVSYSSSRDEGKSDLATRWQSMAKRCPDSDVVLIGYSQGADVAASVWQDPPRGVDVDSVIGVVLYADPRFNRRWVQQGITRPEAAVFKHNGAFGGRPLFDDARAEVVQAWCSPKDIVCQKGVADHIHGPEYDCYEEWAAYELAAAVGPALESKGYAVTEPTAPSCPPSTEGR